MENKQTNKQTNKSEFKIQPSQRPSTLSSERASAWSSTPYPYNSDMQKPNPLSVKKNRVPQHLFTTQRKRGLNIDLHNEKITKLNV